jgi:hypothetical protein
MRTFCASVSLWLVIVAGPAFALTLVPVDFTEMVAGSQLIVHGRVIDVRAQMTAGRRTIQSLVTVAVVDAIKGAPAGEITFVVPGGQIGRYRRLVVGAPEFTAGPAVLLFLTARPPELPMPFGISQGVYRVSGGTVRADSLRHPLAVADFVRQVRSAVRGAR